MNYKTVEKLIELRDTIDSDGTMSLTVRAAITGKLDEIIREMEEAGHAD